MALIEWFESAGKRRRQRLKVNCITKINAASRNSNCRGHVSVRASVSVFPFPPPRKGMPFHVFIFRGNFVFYLHSESGKNNTKKHGQNDRAILQQFCLKEERE